MIPPEGMSLTINVVDGAKPAAFEEYRQYCDGKSEVRVTRCSVSPDIQRILNTYRYNGKLLIESWPQDWGKTAFDNPVREMVTASLAFTGLGIEQVLLDQRDHPDLLADSPKTGPLAVEVTTNLDPSESGFQREMQAFLEMFNRSLEQDFPCNVSLGFVALPPRTDYLRTMHDIAIEVRQNSSQRGIHHFTGALATFFAQFIVGPKEGELRVSGGAVVTERGHADFYATTLGRVDEKRDSADYRVKNRSTWLIVSVTVPLIGPPTMEKLFATNMDLGQFDCIVLSSRNELIVFARLKEDPAKSK
jgi:hypothetical protein